MNKLSKSWKNNRITVSKHTLLVAKYLKFRWKYIRSTPTIRFEVLIVIVHTVQNENNANTRKCFYLMEVNKEYFTVGLHLVTCNRAQPNVCSHWEPSKRSSWHKLLSRLRVMAWTTTCMTIKTQGWKSASKKLTVFRNVNEVLKKWQNMHVCV